MSKRNKPKRRFLNASNQEFAKQELYYKDYGDRYVIDMNKVSRLGMRCHYTCNRVDNKRIQVALPTFHVKLTKIPARNWIQAITWHFHNIYMKGLCDIPK